MSDTDILKTLADAMAGQSKTLAALQEAMARKEQQERGLYTKAPANWQTATPLHGLGGIFSGPGLEPDVISAHVRPYGIAPLLPLLPSISEDPRFPALTGFTANDGSQPEHACEDAPSGYMKSCTLTARFGLVRFDTKTIEMDKVMLRVNRGDFRDLILHGQLFGLTNLEPSGLNQAQILNIITMAEMVGVGVRFERELSTQIWQGTYGVANQFPGLDAQIATGQVDAETNTACAGLDSDVKDYNYAALGPNIVWYLSQLEWYLKHNATTMGHMPVQWVVAMRPDLWFELTAVWPCAYNTDRCTGAVGANSQVFIDGRDNVAERDAMRNGMYITLNGTRYPVVTDTGIFEHNNINNANLLPAEYASSIYMVPLTITGGLPVTFREYLDYRQATVDVALLRNMQEFWWTDNGVYSWAYDGHTWCFKLNAKTEQRIVLRAPMLAGRIDHIRYSPLQHLREPDPASEYFRDGGVSTRPIGSFYSIWAGR